MFPRPPRRPRVVDCFSDCRAQVTGDGDDCECAERSDALYEAECDHRYDLWVEDGHA